jgi:hypothetical protein
MVGRKRFLPVAKSNLSFDLHLMSNVNEIEDIELRFEKVFQRSIRSFILARRSSSPSRVLSLRPTIGQKRMSVVRAVDETLHIDLEEKI